ncbi:hypothetical protein ACFRJ9_07115 [Paenarthrobacter sp. NPDC056912]|uniref:hypothetical protein n=1 Tax=Paenarthrobacter sp. NPDC056912 TaxID=3345965 RepID=UPI003670212D
MSSRILVPLIWGIAGLTLGACLALLIVNSWTPDWIEATGTWFGAVATVLTLLWAVRSFRSDQAEREKGRQAEREKDNAEQIAREEAEMKQARKVSISLSGGTANGSPPNQMMTSFRLRIKNHSKYGVTVHAVNLDDRLKPKRPLPSEHYLQPGEELSELIQVQDIPVQEGDLSGHYTTRFTTEVIYGINGNDWRRNSIGDPKRLLAPTTSLPPAR